MNHFQHLDILFLAAIAGFLIYKLYTVLGQSKGYEGQSPTEDEGKTIIPLRREFVGESNASPLKEPSEQLHHSLRELSRLDPLFETQRFLQGAHRAFEIIIQAYFQADLETIKPLLSSALYHNFSKVLKEYKKNKEACDSSLLRIKSVEIAELDLKKSRAKIKVKYISDQIFVTRDAKGNVIEGDPDQIEVITDEWTFVRKLSSSDPNWQLVAT